MSSRVELEKENKQLQSAVTYFVIAEIVCVFILIIVLYYLFCKRNEEKQKKVNHDVYMGKGAGLMTPQGCNVMYGPHPYKCNDRAVQSYINAGNWDIYKRHNPEQTACAVSPAYSQDFRGGLGTVCEAEARLYKKLHENY